ncbi:MAG: hypothetical protein GX160_07235 [Clostridiales bacterium]|nr:hypothetical protein [Clostridiales bacterium]
MKKKYMLIGVIVIILSIAGYGIYSYYQINNPKGLFENSSEKNTISNKSNDENTGSDADEIDPLLKDPYLFSDRVNFLFLGLDANEQRYKTMGAFRTDTIMLISIDFDDEKVDVISIPRDSYVEIPGRKNREKINAAFVRGGGFKGQGFEKTMETVSKFLGGIPINYYVGVDMNVVIDIVDIMGGVDYDVDVKVRVDNRVIEEGFQRLNGQQVLDYARFRKTRMVDIDRVGRQQKIVLAIFNQLKSTDQILKLPRYYTAVMERVHTNLDIKQIAGLALFAAKIELEDIQFHTIPGEFLDMDSISYWGIDEYKKKELIKEIFGVEIEIDQRNDIRYIKKELEEKEKAYKAAVAQGQDAIDNGNQLIANYENIIKDQEREKIKSYISEINHAIEDGDTDYINKLSSDCRQYVSNLKSVLDERNEAIQRAQTVLGQIAAKREEYKGFINAQENENLNKRIEAVNQAINSMETESINQAIGDLEVYAGEVFKACQQRKEAKEKENKAAAELDQAIKNADAVIADTEAKIGKYKGIIKPEEESALRQKIDAVKQAKNSKDTQAIKKATENLKNSGIDIFNSCEQRKQAGEKDEMDNEATESIGTSESETNQ